MRFRPGLTFILLFCSLAHVVCAAESLPATPVETVESEGAEAIVEGATIIEADTLVGQKGERIEASGDATLSQGGKSIQADRLQYQQDTHELTAEGKVKLQQDGNVMSGPRLQFNLDSNAGMMTQPEYYLFENDARGSASEIRIQDRQHYSLDGATYTTCPAGNTDWLMRMGGLELDRKRQIGVAKHARVEFMSVPILYSPWMDFPLAGQRKSGFLAPIFGSTSKGGSELTLPFYWNLAPNYDATISPRSIAKRGLMLNNEFRYLSRSYDGVMHFDILPDDSLAKRNRARFSIEHDHTLTSRLRSHIDYTRVADNDHFRDLADAVNTTSRVNLLQEGVLNYYGDWWAAGLRVQQYQTLQDVAAPIAVPYARLPQFTLSANKNIAGATLSYDGEYVAFTHPDDVNARRTVLSPGVSYPLVSTPSFYVTPKLKLHSTFYTIGGNNTKGFENTVRTLPIYSLDSGFALERDSNMFGGDYLQTLEPRAFYVYVPYRDQSMLPNFDTALADFSFTQMFSENRFLGSDRIGDANQVTLAITSRLLDKKTGAEKLKVTVGERFSVLTPRVNLGTAATSTGKSDILVGAAGQVTRNFLLDSELEYDPNQSFTQRFNIAARYHPEPGKAFNIGYRYQRDTLRQVDLSSQWPIFQRWHGVGRMNYSFPDSRILDSSAGLEYNQDCWTLRLVVQHFATATKETNTSFFVQLELNDFVKVGSDPLGLLKESVPGYTKLNEKPSKKPGIVWQ
ncbi:MAG: LPS-assembly protein LptD [Gallionella sp.]